MRQQLRIRFGHDDIELKRGVKGMIQLPNALLDGDVDYRLAPVKSRVISYVSRMNLAFTEMGLSIVTSLDVCCFVAVESATDSNGAYLSHNPLI